MRDILYPESDVWQGGDEAVARARASQVRPLPKRFYHDVSVAPGEGGHLVLLDGRKARTPGRNLLALATEAAARVVAEEWIAQKDHIDPADMHATRIANVGIDRVEAARAAVIADIAGYARSDLTCYRAEGPEGLVAREDRCWTPVLDHIRARYGARFILSQGITPVAQDEAAILAVAEGYRRYTDPVALAALHTLVALAGSALLPLALADGALDVDGAFTAAHVEEDWNTHLWGRDAEAEARMARRRAEFTAAARLLAALAAPE